MTDEREELRMGMTEVEDAYQRGAEELRAKLLEIWNRAPHDSGYWPPHHGGCQSPYGGKCSCGVGAWGEEWDRALRG